MSFVITSLVSAFKDVEFYYNYDDDEDDDSDDDDDDDDDDDSYCDDYSCWYPHHDGDFDYSSHCNQNHTI